MIREGVPVNDKSNAPASANAISTALKTFARTLSQHSERQSDLIDVFATALKERQTQLTAEIRNQSLQNRLDMAEARIAELEKVVGAIRRQGLGSRRPSARRAAREGRRGRKRRVRQRREARSAQRREATGARTPMLVH